MKNNILVVVMLFSLFGIITPNCFASGNAAPVSDCYDIKCRERLVNWSDGITSCFQAVSRQQVVSCREDAH